MCFGSPKVEPAPPPAAPPSANPVLTNMYDPSSPESGLIAEKGSMLNKAAGTSQLNIPLDPTVTDLGKGTGLQINK
jgi:hypothetical protein